MPDLSPRQLEVLFWIAQGKTDEETGQILGMSQRTARFHVEQAKARLGTNSRIHAVIIALGRIESRHGPIPRPVLPVQPQQDRRKAQNSLAAVPK